MFSIEVLIFNLAEVAANGDIVTLRKIEWMLSAVKVAPDIEAGIYNAKVTILYCISTCT